MMKYLPPILLAATLLLAGCNEDTTSDDAGDATPQSYSNTDYSDALEAAAYEDQIRDDIYWSAYAEGYAEGEREGQSGGYDLGYDDGYQDGYDEGWLDGCVWLGNTLIANGADIWYQC